MTVSWHNFFFVGLISGEADGRRVHRHINEICQKYNECYCCCFCYCIIVGRCKPHSLLPLLFLFLFLFSFTFFSSIYTFYYCQPVFVSHSVNNVIIKVHHLCMSDCLCVHLCVCVCICVFLGKLLQTVVLAIQLTIASFTREYNDSLIHDKLFLLRLFVVVVVVFVAVVRSFLLFTYSMSKVFTFEWNELILTHSNVSKQRSLTHIHTCICK